jgi:hypothetical protein
MYNIVSEETIFKRKKSLNYNHVFNQKLFSGIIHVHSLFMTLLLFQMLSHDESTSIFLNTAKLAKGLHQI